MDNEDTVTDQKGQRWLIALDWYERNARSFWVVARGSLCSGCRQRLEARQGEVTVDGLLAAVKECCSKALGFINGELPILESIFRLFLANGNYPLDLAELGSQLSEWRGGDSYRTSQEMLSRLLENDQFYGLSQVTD